MSTPPPTATADEAKGFMIANCVSFATSALFVYEYLITINQEVNFVWREKWRLSSGLFFVNRYVALLVAIVYAIPLINYKSCIAGVDMIKVTALIQLLIIAVFSAQRVYVMSRRSIWITLLVFALSAVPFAVNIWVFVKSVLYYEPGLLCVSAPVANFELVLGRRLRNIFPISNKLTMTLVATTTRATAMLADIIVISITFKNSYKQWKAVRDLKYMQMQVTLPEIMLRDGSIYFIAMAIINVFFVLDNLLPYLAAFPPMLALTQSMPPILTSRMLLNLREAVDLRTGQADGAGEMSMIRFVDSRGISSAGGLNGRVARRPTSDDLDLDLYDDQSRSVEDDSNYSREGESDEQAILEVRRGLRSC